MIQSKLDMSYSFSPKRVFLEMRGAEQDEWDITSLKKIKYLLQRKS